MKVIAVFKTHVDVGFTDLPMKILKRYSSRLLLKIVEACEKSEGDKNPLVWTMPAFVLHYALRNAAKELRERTEALIRKDRIVWHALPFTLRTEFFTGFELRETLYYAKELSGAYNKPMPISAKMTDVPGHTQALVDVLCENGVKFLHLGCNPASTPPAVPRFFFWESKSGNRILVCYDKDYGGCVIPPEGYKYPVHLSMNVSGDNAGVHQAGIIEQLEKELKEYDADAEFCTGTMDDFARELLACDLHELPVIKGELGDTWIAGLGAFPEVSVAIGKARRHFEEVSRFLKEKGDTEFKHLEREYLENLMLFGEHSGGVDVKKLISPRRAYEKSELLAALETEPYRYADKGWNDERKWSFNARAAAFKLQHAVESKYGISFDRAENAFSKSSDFKTEIKDGTIRITNASSGAEIKVSYLYEIIGQKSIDRYLDGYLTKRVDWSLADFGRYKMDGTNTYPNVEDMLFTPALLKTSKSAYVKTATYKSDEESFAEYGNAEEISISAKNEGTRVRVRVIIKNKQPTLYAEGGYVCFDFGENLKNLTIAKSGVEIDPKTDIVSGANTALFAVNYVKTNGITLQPVNSPLVCFGEPKIYRNNTQKFTMPQNGKVLFNLYNNMWATGCPQWVSGSYTFEFYIY